MIIKRIFFTLLLLVAVLYAPWWLALLVAMYGTFYFPRYYEVIVFGALVDLFYGIPGSILVGYGALGFFVGVVIFVLFERVKRELR
jgi:hypothetical protein